MKQLDDVILKMNKQALPILIEVDKAGDIFVYTKQYALEFLEKTLVECGLQDTKLRISICKDDCTFVQQTNTVYLKIKKKVLARF